VPTAGIAPVETSKIGLEINLDSRGKITATGGTPPIDFSDKSTYTDSTSMNVYDAKGQAVSLTYFFQKSGNDTWNLYATANGEPINLDSSGVPQPISQITFPSDGSTPSVPAAAFTFNIPATGVGTAVETVPLTDVSLDLRGLTQFGNPFGPTNLSQNGTPPGRLSSIDVQDDGTVVAMYSSGQSAAIGQIELASFRNPQGLQPLGGNTWGATYYSGDPVLGAPGSGNLGQLQASSLEESNIDLTNELVNMMVAQRIYQANAQTIKTQDSVMQTLVSLR
jgi:flagellar hook protein FlgE